MYPHPNPHHHQPQQPFNSTTSLSEKYQHLFSSSTKTNITNPNINHHEYKPRTIPPPTTTINNSTNNNNNIGLNSSRTLSIGGGTFISNNNRGNGMINISSSSLPQKKAFLTTNYGINNDFNNGRNNWMTSQDENCTKLNEKLSTSLMGGFKRELSPSLVRKNLDVSLLNVMNDDDHQIHSFNSQKVDYLSRSSFYQKPKKPITSWKPLSDQERSAIATNLLNSSSVSSSSNTHNSVMLNSSHVEIGTNKSIFDSSDEEDDELIASRKRMKMNHGKLNQIDLSNNNNSTSHHSIHTLSNINNTMNTMNTNNNTNNTINTINNTMNSLNSRLSSVNIKNSDHSIVSSSCNDILSNPLTLADRFKRLNEKQPLRTDSKPSLLVTKSLLNSSTLGALGNTSPLRESIYINSIDNNEEDMSFTRLNSTILTSTSNLTITANNNTNNINTNNITNNTNNNTTINTNNNITNNTILTSSLGVPLLNSQITTTTTINSGTSSKKKMNVPSLLNTTNTSTCNNTSSITRSIGGSSIGNTSIISSNMTPTMLMNTSTTTTHMTSGKHHQQMRKNREELIIYQTLLYQIHYIVAMVLKSFEKQELKVEQELYSGWSFVQECKKSLHDRREQLFKNQSTLKLHELLNYGLNVKSIDQLLLNIDQYFRNYNEIQMELKQTLNCIAISDDIEVSTPEMNISNGIESGIELAFSLEKSFKILQQVFNEMNQVMNDTLQLRTQFTHLNDIIHQSTSELNTLSNHYIPHLSNIESEHTSLVFQSTFQSFDSSSDPFAFNLLRESLGV